MRALVSFIRRFGREDRGAAAVEFALILPFLIVLFMGSIEASSLITVDRRVNVISGTVGDLIARWDSKGGTNPVATTTLKDYFTASQGIMYPYSVTALKQTVSVIKITSGGVATVTMSCGYNGGSARAANSAFALPANLKSVATPAVTVPATFGWVIASEAAYSYKPVLGMVFKNALNLNSTSYYLPRFEKEITFATCPT
jgi:Flp pilus assembly protein TadG